MAGLSTFNNSLITGQSEFKVGKYTEENSIYNWYCKDKFKNYKGMLVAWNQRRLINTPLLNETELKNNVIYVNGAEGGFTYSVPYEMPLPYIVENLAAGNATPGIDGQRFKIKLSQNCYTNTDRITYDYMNGIVLFITEDEIYPETDGWVYTVEVAALDRKNTYLPPEFLAPGTEFMKISNSNGEYSQQKSSINARFGNMKLETNLAGHRSVAHWITAYADILKVEDPGLRWISDAYGNRNAKASTMVLYNKHQDGKPVKGSLRWINMVDALLWAEMKKMEELDLMWSKGGFVTGADHRPIPVGLGLWEQLKAGNRFKYSKLTKAILDEAFGNMFYGSGINVEDRKVKVQCGQAALIEISRIIENEANKIPFVLDGTKMGIIEGNRMNLNLGYRFVSMQFPSAGWVEFEHNPAFDNTYTRAQDSINGEYPLMSHTLAVFDVTDRDSTNAAAKIENQFRYEEGFSGNSNLALIKPEGMESTVWGYELGTHAPHGLNSGPIYSSSQKDGYGIWMKNISMLWLKDATRSVLLEKNPLV